MSDNIKKIKDNQKRFCWVNDLDSLKHDQVSVSIEKILKFIK